MEEDGRTRAGSIVAIAGLLGNLVLFAVKIVVGVWIGSLALIADAADTLGDVLMAGVTWLGFKIGARGPDPAHPYGHERAEEIAALTVAILLVFAGFQFGIESVKRLLDPDPRVFPFWAVWAVLATLVVKVVLARISFVVGRRIESHALTGTAWNYVADAAASVLVVVALVASRYGYAWIDAVVAFVIGVLLARLGIKLFFRSSDVLMGHGAGPKLRREIDRLVCAQPGVLGCSHVEVHWYGRKRRLSLRIEVPDTLTVQEAHAIAKRVEAALMGEHADWEPVVHVVPVERRPEPLA